MSTVGEGDETNLSGLLLYDLTGASHFAATTEMPAKQTQELVAAWENSDIDCQRHQERSYEGTHVATSVCVIERSGGILPAVHTLVPALLDHSSAPEERLSALRAEGGSLLAKPVFIAHLSGAL